MALSTRKIRPAARLISTIGKDLIKDTHAAIVELVKNAYDADSSYVKVNFSYNTTKKRLLIKVEDAGQGMAPDTVVNKWLVPATDDKLKRKISQKGRALQGSKGIGRFSATMLGERILLETTHQGTTSSLILDMDVLDKIDYLDQFELEMSEEITKAKNGTIIEIEKDDITEEDIQLIWSSSQLNKLHTELRRLISPEDIYRSANEQGYKIQYEPFKIELIFGDFPINDFCNKKITIKPFNVLDLYDYRIFGKIDKDGYANLYFSNQNIPGMPIEPIKQSIPLESESSMRYPGAVFIDLRVYDRDPEGIEHIIQRGLMDVDGTYVGKRKAKEILNELYGIGIYRQQFRIRPYGDANFDWLDLDKNRVQNPSYNIGHNQIIGFVYIEPEESSNLVEKSARDGLFENHAYHGLKRIISQVVNETSARRKNYRDTVKKGGRNKKSMQDDVDDLFDLSGFDQRISYGLAKLNLAEEEQKAVDKVVRQAIIEENHKKSATAKKFRDDLAVYQGQVTLGKIVHVLLHEGRKNIKYISETTPRVARWINKLIIKKDAELIVKLQDRSEKVIIHAKELSYLFKKIQPLAVTKHSPDKQHNLQNILREVFDIFVGDMNHYGIKYDITPEMEGLTVLANHMDLLTVFSNIIENSIYWLQYIKDHRSIQILIQKDGQDIIVDCRDNGPGFHEGKLGFLFEPGYSMKPNGTGLGLALAGEVMSRIGGTIHAERLEKGACFRVTFTGEKNVTAIIRLLIVEDKGDLFEGYKDAIEECHEKDASVVFQCKREIDLESARARLLSEDFDAAIVDLSLDPHDKSKCSGNDIIKDIIDRYRFPVFVVSGNLGKLNSDIREKKSLLLQFYDRDEPNHEIFDEIQKVHQTGVARILGGRGLIEDKLAEIFWNHFPQKLSEQGDLSEKVLLRYMVSHLSEYLDLPSESDEYYQDMEFYIKPPIRKNIASGDVIENIESKKRYILLSPACDVASRGEGSEGHPIINATRLVIAPLIKVCRDDFLDKNILKEETKSKGIENTLKEIIHGQREKYFFLPEYNGMYASVVELQNIWTVTLSEYLDDYTRLATVSSEFLKDIQSRFSAYYGRQGHPDIDKKRLLKKHAPDLKIN